MVLTDSKSITRLPQILFRHNRRCRVEPAQSLADALEKKHAPFDFFGYEGQKETKRPCRGFGLGTKVRSDAPTQPLALSHPNRRILLGKPSLATPHLAQTPNALFSVKRIAACLLSSTLAVSGCSALSGQYGPSDLSSRARPLPRYNAEGWLPPERMEQFASPGKGAVYRFCTDDCPAPTPKVPHIASAGNTPPGAVTRSPIPDYVATPLPLMAHSPAEIILTQQDAHMESIVAEAEAYLRDHPAQSALPVMKNPLPQPERPDRRDLPAPVSKTPPPRPVIGTASPSHRLTSKSSAPDHLSQPSPDALPRASAASPVEPSRSVPTLSLNGVVFVTNRSTLDDAGQHAVADLAEAAHHAEMINLRGYAAPIPPEDKAEFNQLAIARALSVKRALAETGIDQAKIRILSTKYQFIDPVNVLAPANRSVVVSFRRPDGQIIKTTAQAVIPRSDRARAAQRAVFAGASVKPEPADPMRSHRQIENYNAIREDTAPRLALAQGGSS